MRQFATAALAALILASVTGGGGSAQTADNSAPAARPDMVDRFYRGRAVVNAAVAATGGAQAIRGVVGLSYVVQGDLSNDIQGYAASRVGDPARDGSLRVLQVG